MFRSATQFFTNSPIKIALVFVLQLVANSTLAQGLTSGTIQIIPNSTATPGVSETVTMGIPFAACTVTGVDRNNQFKLKDENGAEVAIFVKETMTWPSRAPCSEASTRALKVQFVFNATGGQKEYSWDLTGRTVANDIAEDTTHDEVTTAKVATKGSLMEPTVFAIHDPDYLVQSGIIPPTVPVPDVIPVADTYDSNYYPDVWEYYARDFDFTTSSAANWLFDRTSAAYKQAIRRGDVEHYREAFLHHEFWISKIEDTGAASSNNCVGGFDFDSKATSTNCDAKYIYLEPEKLHLALTGDDSWTPDANIYAASRDDMFVQMASILFDGTNRASFSNGAITATGFSTPYTDLDDLYTERKTGIGFTTTLAACELTADPTTCDNVDTIFDNIYDMAQNTVDGVGVTGYLSHSWRAHEFVNGQWVGNVASKSGTTFTVENVFGDLAPLGGTAGGEQPLKTGDTITLTNQFTGTDYTLASDAQDLGGGVWQLETTVAITEPIGDSVFADDYDLISDRAFSPWMTAQIVGGIWQYYHFTDDATQKTKAEELLRGFGRAIVAYALDLGLNNAETIQRTTTTLESLVESAFGVEIKNGGFFEVGCGLTKAPYVRYVAAASHAVPGVEFPTEYAHFIAGSGGDFADVHLPELIFIVSLGAFFETDQDKKKAMQQFLEDSMDWFDQYSCTSGNKDKGAALSPPARAFAWQNKDDPFGTYKYVSQFKLEFSGDTFTEALSNDGSSSDVLTLTLGGAKFLDPGGDGTYTGGGVDFDVTGLPAGFTGATLTYVNSSTAELRLTGAAVANDPVNNISNLSFVLNDSAMVDSFDADRITNSTKSDLAIQFINPSITYSGTSFTESAENDGSTTTQITLDLEGDTFTTAAGDFPGGLFTVSGLPTGTLAGKLTANSNVQAVLTLTGNASPHGNGADTSGISFQFNDGAFTTTATAADVTDFSNTLSFDFFEPALSFSGTTFNENTGTNDGAISNTLTVTLSDDTFVVPDGPMNGTHFTTANVPNGLTVEVTGTSDTTATIALTGTADSHAVDISDLTLNFLPAALTTTTNVSNVAGASTSNLIIDYISPSIAYGGTNFTEDAATNDGSISNSLGITLTDDTFTVPGGAMTLNTHFTVSNLPAGLTPVVTGTSATTATFGLSGSANNHGNADEISSLELSFLPAAFTNSISTANLTNATKSDLSISFVEPAISYNASTFNENAATDNGSIGNMLTLTLSEDDFRCTSCQLTDGVDYNTANLPSSLGLDVDIDATGKIATLTLTGTADAHTNAEDINNFTLNFTDAAFQTSPAASILEAMKMDIAINFFQDGIEYDFNTFVESNNDGSTNTLLTLTLLGDTFVISGGPMTESTHYEVANVPAGLSAAVTGTTANTATLALTGNATSHGDSDDVSDLTLTFLDGAFTGNDASVIANSSKSDLSVEFLDGSLSFSSNVFNEAITNDGSIDNTIDISLAADTFVAGPFSSPTHFTATNVPSGLSAVVTRNSQTSATLSLTGTADNSANSDDVSNLTLTFADAAFGGGDASAVTGSTKTDIQVDFVDASLSFSSSTFVETAGDTGQIENTLNLTLVGDSLVINGGQMLNGTHYTVANVPAGLTAVVTGTGSSTATFALTGNATSHADADGVSNLTLTFLDAAFVNGDASAVSNSNRADLVVDFITSSGGGGGGGGSGGGGGGGGGGSDSGNTDDSSDDTDPPPPSGPPVNEGTSTGLALTVGETLENRGTLIDPTNGGVINGGMLGGNVTNLATGVLNDVNLLSGSVVSGGKVTGALRGSGTVMNAVLDVSAIDPGVKLGSGVKLTKSTVGNLPGLNLASAITDQNGDLDLNQPLLIDDDGGELTVLDLATRAVDNLFGNDATQINDGAQSDTKTIANPEIGDAVVVVSPTRVETSDLSDSVFLNSRGELNIISDGIKTTFAPSPADAEAFSNALEANNSTSSELENGLVFVEFNGGTFSFHFSYLASEATGSNLTRALESGDVSFTEIGNIGSPASYRIIVNYADGSRQELIPAVHDLDVFESWLEGDGYSIEIDSLTGIISVSRDSALVFKGIPAYTLEEPQSSLFKVDFETFNDVNNDGVSDLYFDTNNYRQVIYGVPLNP